MKKGKKAILAIAVLSIAVMMVTATVPVLGKSEQLSNHDTFDFITGAKKADFEIVEKGKTGALTYAGDVLITPDSPEDDRFPDLTKDQYGNIVATWTHEVSILDKDYGLAYSADNGNTWTSSLVVQEGLQTYSAISYADGSAYEGGGDFNGLWGSWVEPMADQAGCMRISDITDLSTLEAIVTSDQPGLDYNSMEDNSWYDMTYYEYYGPVSFHIYDGQGLERGLVIYWWDGEFAGIVENWDAQANIISSPSQDPDMANVHDADPAHTENDYFYLTWQHNNQDTGRSRVGYKQVVPVNEADMEFVDNQGYIDESNTYDAAHPDIDASASRVVAVYMINDNDDWDIKCAYSTDKGETWSFSMVVNEHPASEVYPAVYLSGNTVFCTYIKGGNLYLVESEDGGVTWGEPAQINEQDGTVVEEENAVKIHAGGIVWTDNRNGNKDIYYAPLAVGAILNVEAISGGMGITATITNTGTEDATGVPWSIDVSGLVFLGGHTEGTIDVLAGGEATISSGLVFGIGPGTIAVTAGGASKTASCFILGPLVLGVS